MDQFNLNAYVSRVHNGDTPDCPICSIPMVEIRQGVLSCPMDLVLDEALRERVALVIEHELSKEEKHGQQPNAPR